MRISARLSVEPAIWPARALQDVTLRMILKNEGASAAVVYPLIAKTIPRTSMAGEGIEWTLQATAAGNRAPVRIQEIRTYYGPPGEPRAAKWLKANGQVTLSPGREHATEIAACWIPNSLLKPEQLDPAMLDPDGMDGIGPRKFDLPAGQESAPPLSSLIPLTKASILVLGRRCADMKKDLGKKRELLRGEVVGFFPAPGAYVLEASFIQDSWMQIGEKLSVPTAPVSISVGEH
jgi:hypothetical protein